MNVVTALNRKYLKYTAVMLPSLCENNRSGIDAYLLHSELTGDDINLLSEALSLNGYDITLHPLEVDRSRFSKRLPTNDQWSLETYFRLLLPDMLPQSVEKILYLDVDMIINRSLEEIYDSDLSDCDILTCEDACGQKTLDKFSDRQLAMLSPLLDKGYRYFNAGFMLMNMERIRARVGFDDYLRAIEEWEYEMAAPDQDILNYMHGEYIAYADWAVYDLFAKVAHNFGITYEEVKAQTAVIHYAGSKPWDGGSVHFDIEQLWWDYAKKTPFYVELMEEFILKTNCHNEELEDAFSHLYDENQSLKDQINSLAAAIRRLG